MIRAVAQSSGRSTKTRRLSNVTICLTAATLLADTAGAFKAAPSTCISKNPRQFHSSASSSLRMAPNDEVAAAQRAAANRVDGEPPTVFDKILSGEWSSDKVHEDDLCLAFRDVNPQGPVHILLIPKNRDGLTMLSRAREDQKGLLGHLLYVAQEVGKKECPQGFRIVINDGEHGSQSVYHLHLHLIGKFQRFALSKRNSV